MMKNIWLTAIMLTGLVLTIGTSSSADRHAGYYYPEPQTKEVYEARVIDPGISSKQTRTLFVIGVHNEQQARGYAPTYHMFIKGEEGEKLIIVATGDGYYDTLFRLRALIASLSSSARTSSIFQNVPNPENLTFLDFCKILGFKQITISNGKDIAHQIVLE